MKKELIIIGAGPAGLKAAEQAQKNNIDYLVLEKGKVGSAWAQIRSDMPMLSPCHPQRDWTSLSKDFPIWKMDVDRPYCYARDFVEYMCKFSEHFALNIKEDNKVTRVKKNNDEFIIDTDSQKFRSTYLLLTTGFFNNPYIPDIRGVRDNPVVTHSHYYQSKNDYKKQRVIIVGGGNSAAEIAIDLCGFSQVYLISRGQLKYFSNTKNLCNIRGTYESYLKELMKMELIRHYENTKVIEVDGQTVHFDNGKKLQTNCLMFATGYVPAVHTFQFENLEYDSKEEEKMFAQSGESKQIDNLFFGGPLYIKNTSNNFIHGFIKEITLTVNEIMQRIKSTK